MAEHGLTLLRVSIGLIFLWFGAIKFWPGLSAADQLATDTIEKISFGLIGEDVARVALAGAEAATAAPGDSSMVAAIRPPPSRRGSGTRPPSS